MKIYFDDLELDQDYYTQLKQSFLMFNDGETFKLGMAMCNGLTFGVDKERISNIPDNIKITIDDEEYGNYVLDDVKDENYERIYSLTDKMINFSFNYDASLLINNSIAEENGHKYVLLKDILNDMCVKAGVVLATADFIGADKHISWYDNTISARDYIGYIAELNGGYALINKSGELELRQFDNYIRKSINIEDCDSFIIGEYHKITRVVWDCGVDKYEAGDETGNTLYLSDSNPFITEQEDIDKIYNVVKNLEFYSFSVNNCPIYNDVLPGDCIEFSDGENSYKTFAQYDISFFGTWLGGYKFNVASSKQEETKIIGNNDSIKSIKSRLNRDEATLEITSEQTTENNSKIAKLEISTENIKSEVSESIGDQNEKISQVTQTVNELNSKISDVADITTSEKSEFAYVELDHINASEPIRLEIRPLGTDISYLYPHDNLFPSDYLFMTTRTIRFHNKTTDENIDYELPDDLFYYDSEHYDEFILDYDTRICNIIKRVGIDENGNKYLLEDISSIEYEYPTINLTDGDYEISVLGYESAYIFVRLMAQNIYTTQFATRVEVNSEIAQTANAINEQVKVKVGDDEIIAKLNLAIKDEQGTIELTGDQILINSNHFILDGEGNLQCENADIKGTINSSSGSIGNWEINDKGLLNNDFFVSYGSREIQNQVFNYGVSNIYTMSDVIICQSILLKVLPTPEEDSAEFKHYDVNNNGRIDAQDLLIIKGIIEGWQ